MNEITPTIDPRHAMLLVMDCQLAILDNLPGAGELLPRLAEAIDAARNGGVRVGYVWLGFTDADYDAVPHTNTRFAGIAASRRMRAEAPETAIHETVAPRRGDLVVRKTRVGAFSTTNLDQQLRDRQIDTLILGGIATSGVVLSTARDAADHDYRLYVLEDGCADRDRDVHALLMQKVFPHQACVISIADLASRLGAP